MFLHVLLSHPESCQNIKLVQDQSPVVKVMSTQKDGDKV